MCKCTVHVYVLCILVFITIVQRPDSPSSDGVFSLEKFSSPYLHLPGTYSLGFDMGDSFLSNNSPDMSVTSYILEGTTPDGINSYYWIVRREGREGEGERERSGDYRSEKT